MRAQCPPFPAGERDRELQRAGWRRQFAYDEPRLSEAVEIYQQLGYEVHLEPVLPQELPGEWPSCFDFAPERYKTIWVRPKPAAGR
jgi:hypothetical protein